MNKILTQIIGGTLGFAGAAEVAQDGLNQSTDFITQNIPALQNPDTYVKGLIVSGIIQVALKLIDRFFEKRKAKKEAKAAEIAE